ncbi:MAG: glycosyltransferase [Planctomycetes bacterium]|nr:glycosyltransferase [Planctomycetota bacterium]
MRIAILNSWPNVPLCAEKEFIVRALIALRRMGWEASEVVTSDDIKAFEPDCVLVTHEFSPKLTAFPTIGIMWSPPAFFRDDPVRIRSILTYDGYLSGSKAITHFLDDLQFSTQTMMPVSNVGFYPTCYRTEFPIDPPQDRTLFYAGTGWDGARHGDLFQQLLRRVPVAFYGPPKAWQFAGNCYFGVLPVDGYAVVDAIRSHGVALCIHKDEHLAANVPSMRLFEAAAAGAVIITDRLGFTRDHFGDSVLYIDLDQPAKAVANQIEAHMNWIASHPQESLAMAREAHAVFNRDFCLEEQFQRLPMFVERVRAAGHFDAPAKVRSLPEGEPPMVEYIVRVGSRPAATIDRCLSGLSGQTYPNIGVILVQFGPIQGFDALIDKYRDRFRSLKVVPAERGLRSTAYWAGLNAVTAPYFANCDDDDWLAPNHVATVLDALHRRPNTSFAYSGTVLVQDEPGHYTQLSNFNGPTGALIRENHSLFFFDPFNIGRLARRENYINSNSWIARRELLDEQLLRDPELNVAEDFLLLLAFLQKTGFAFTWRPTAQWHWRSTTKDNTTFCEFDTDTDYVKRLALRFQFAHWNNAYINTSSPPSPVLLLRLEKVYYALAGIKRTLTQPSRWLQRLRTACRTVYKRGLKGLILHSADVGRRRSIG